MTARPDVRPGATRFGRHSVNRLILGKHVRVAVGRYRGMQSRVYTRQSIATAVRRRPRLRILEAHPPMMTYKPLLYNRYSYRSDCPGSVTSVRPNCVFFAQQSVGKRPRGLWEGCFFVAWRGAIANLTPATEGGIPMSRCPVVGSHCVIPSLQFVCVSGSSSGVKRPPESGEPGEVPSVLSHWADTEPSHKKQCFGGSR